jgi:hypothetical protein
VAKEGGQIIVTLSIQIGLSKNNRPSSQITALHKKKRGGLSERHGLALP